MHRRNNLGEVDAMSLGRNIKKYRHALYAGILADIFGIVAAIVVCNLFFA